MDAVKGYVMCALLASALAGILKNLSSGMRSFERYVGFVCSLVVIIILSAPLVGVISDIKDIISENTAVSEENSDVIADESARDTMAAYLSESLEETIKDLVCDRFSISKEEIGVSAVLDGEYSVEKIIVCVYSDTDTDEIKNFTENILCISTEIRRINENEN